MIEVLRLTPLTCGYSTSEEYFMYNRRSIRLKGYDYSSDGYYFITICTYQKQQIFGTIKNGIMHLNDYGKIAHNEWIESDQIRHELKLDEFIIMPDHMHGIVIINTRRGAWPCAPTNTPCAPTNTPCAPTNTQYAPTNTPCAPTNTQYAPTNTPCAPTNTQYAPTNTQYAPTGITKFESEFNPSYNNNENSGIGIRLPKSISSFIAGYKSSVTTQINRMRNTRGKKIWQRNYYDHIIRSEKDYYRIAEYIRHNPRKKHDKEISSSLRKNYSINT